MERYPGYPTYILVSKQAGVRCKQRRSGAVVPPSLLCLPSRAVVLSSQSLDYALLATFYFGLYAYSLHCWFSGLSHLARAERALAPSPTASVVCFAINTLHSTFTHYSPTEGGRSSLRPGKGQYPR
eukprot:6203748-Pleurochrysis_carterae.AAC.8